MVRFRTGPTQPSRAHRPPPPNYFSRSTQIRLLMLVGSLMLVLYLMWEARNPKNWAWMWANARPTAAPVESTDETVNTRLPPPAPGQDAIDGAVLKHAPRSRNDTFAEAIPDSDVLTRTRNSAWSQLIDNLERADRTLLDKVLKSSRDRSSLEKEDRQRWETVLETLTQQWVLFHEQADQAIRDAGDEIPASERELWVQVLEEVDREWKEETRTTLQSAQNARPWTDQQRLVLARLQAILDGLALEAVHDDTVWRGAEQYAWFRLMEKLRDANAGAATAADAQPTGYLALFRQPEAYRGKLVRFRGTATLAYRVRAPENLLGIENYFVFWLRPEGGPNSPLVVYALEAPPGFPEIQDKDIDRSTTRLEEDFEIVGYFFKRWAYRAQDGLNTAPVLLAKSPRWLSAPIATELQTPPRVANVVMSVLALVVCAIGLAGLAYWSNRPDPTVQRFVKEAENRAQVPAVPEDAPPGIQESLQRLSEGEIDGTSNERIRDV